MEKTELVKEFGYLVIMIRTAIRRLKEGE